jgi:hypothetical protein
MKKFLFGIILSMAGIAIIAVITGFIITNIQFKNEVSVLFLSSKNISGKIFNYTELKTLPEPVQRYFRHVLKDGQPYISYARLRHDGQFRLGMKEEWVDIEGEQYFTMENPGFIWKGNITLFTARDMFINDKGKLVVNFLSALQIVKAEGAKYDRGELLRWLCESVWFPTNFLPGKYMKWTPIDKNTAGLTFNYNDIALHCKISFNDKGEIVQMESKRHMDETRYETWIGTCGDYREMNGVLIPLKIEVLWRLKDGDFTYAKFHIREIEYNTPEQY